VTVLFITRKYPPSTGGMELFAYDLSSTLAGKLNLRLVKWGGSGRLKAVLVALPFLTLTASWQLLRGKVDVIHAQDGVLAPTTYLLSKLFRKPFVVVVHGLDLTYQNPLFRISVPWAVRRAAVIFCISQAAAEAALQRGVDQEKICTIPLAVTDNLYGKADRAVLVKRLQLSPQAKILLTVGRLVQRKGVAWFIDAVLPDLVQRHPELCYVIIGEGAARPAIEAAIERTGLAEHVRLLGRVTDDELYQAAYNGADVFVMPNITVPDDVEGFGLVLLEASACARPVVAANIEGIKDAVTDGKNGVLVPERDAAAFLKAIDRFLADPHYAADFGRRSRDFTLQTYQWQKLADRYIEQYQRLLN
jgi:phosphatidylinositol alpha-1,6-mannosyltransferase